YRPSGFQVWDLSNLDKAREVLHLPSIGIVISACVQPSSTDTHQPRPPRLLLLNRTGDGTIFLVYDLHSYACIKRVEVSNAKAVQANHKFIAISAESTSGNNATAGLHILSVSDDYKLIYTISSGLLSPHTLTDPLFHLSSNRLLAYSSAIPPVHRISTQSPYTGTSYPPTSVNEGTPIPKVGSGATSVLTSGLAYVGGGVITGAMRLGAGVVEGVKLGINASGYGNTSSAGPYQRSDVERGAFSRSAPASHPSPLSSRGHNRKGSGQRRSAVSGPGYVPGEQQPESDSGQWITIIDLEPLLAPMEAPSTDNADHRDHANAGHSSSRLSRSSSFVVNQPPLTQLSETFINDRDPELVAEFRYLPLTSLASTLIHRGGGSSASTSNTDVRTSSLVPASSNADDHMNSAVSAVQWSPSGTMLAIDSVIASWSLRRGDDWKEYRQPWSSLSDTRKKPTRGSLFHAEVTPSSTHLGRVPRPIYLSHQFQFSALANDYHALVRKLDLDPPSVPLLARKESVIVRPGEGLPHEARYGANTPSDFDSDAHFLGTNPHLLDLTESPLLGGNLGLAIDNAPFSSSLASTNSVSSHSRGSRPGTRRSFDDNLTSAMESQLQLHASYSPSGSSSDIASPGHVIPMLPNGRPGSSGSGSGLATGIDAVVRGTTRVGKEVWGGLSNVRSPRLLPTKRNSATADLLKFDEEEEMFIVDDLDVAAEAQVGSPQETFTAIPAVDSTLKKDESVATIAPGTWSVPGSVAYPRMTDSGMTITGSSRPRAGSQTPGSTDDPSWVEQTDVYVQAVEEDARFHDVTGILDEEREERENMQQKMGQMSTSSPIAPD
ncbi:hypothetical protein FRC20_004058, partial [Serendipita sp. 405]